MYDTLLFLHVLSAFALMAPVVIFSAFVLGARADSRILSIGNVLWAIGGLGTIVFGVWLALYVKGYDLLDGWVIAAIVLWFIASGLGGRVQASFNEAFSAREGGVAIALPSQAVMLHWLRTLAVLLLLIDMVYKPGH
ncbi:MAG: hypothetical protein ACJ76V_00250 [Thermoleophilaceae bacterium]